jgi:hypothetical protein
MQEGGDGAKEAADAQDRHPIHAAQRSIKEESGFVHDGRETRGERKVVS